MEDTQAIYGQLKQETKQTNNNFEKRDNKKRDLILKNKELSIKLKDTYIEVSDGVLSQIYGVQNIKNLYIHKDIALNISDCFAISKYIKIFFIDGYGNIIAKYKRVKTV
ncbi:MAG: hypothetical protein U9O56_08415 [Campylobacterota bacterium]|nr:hypothetical protein [Campylobacterota bacterium]